MLPQVQGPEHTTEAREAEVQRWLLGMLKQYGPGKYVLVLSPDGRLMAKRFPAPVRMICPQALRIDHA